LGDLSPKLEGSCARFRFQIWGIEATAYPVPIVTRYGLQSSRQIATKLVAAKLISLPIVCLWLAAIGDTSWELHWVRRRVRTCASVCELVFSDRQKRARKSRRKADALTERSPCRLRHCSVAEPMQWIATVAYCSTANEAINTELSIAVVVWSADDGRIGRNMRLTACTVQKNRRHCFVITGSDIGIHILLLGCRLRVPVYLQYGDFKNITLVATRIEIDTRAPHIPRLKSIGFCPRYVIAPPPPYRTADVNSLSVSGHFEL